MIAIRSHTSAVAVAATSVGGFLQVVPALVQLGCVGERGPMLLIGVPPWDPFASCWAPMTGLVTRAKVLADAVRDAEHAARAAATAQPADIAIRYCACAGWRDAALPVALRQFGCQHLIVPVSSLPVWLRPSLRRHLAEVGASLLTVNSDPLSLAAVLKEGSLV